MESATRRTPSISSLQNRWKKPLKDNIEEVTLTIIVHVLYLDGFHFLRSHISHILDSGRYRTGYRVLYRDCIVFSGVLRANWLGTCHLSQRG